MLRETSEMSLMRQPAGMLAPWVVLVITVACAVTFVGVTLGAALLWDQLPSWADLGAFRHGLTFFISFWLLATFLPQWQLARSLRVAVLLPVAHAFVIACAWPVWQMVSPLALDPDATTRFAATFPLALVAVGGAVALGATAWLLSRRRSGEWVHGFAMLALAELLLLGLWIPIACTSWPGGSAEMWSAYEPLLADLGPRLAFTLIPPTLLAISFTALALRRPAALKASRGGLDVALVMLFIVAVFVRATASGRVLLLYSNFLPVLLAAALVAMVSLVALGGVTWWRTAATHRAFASRARRGGTVVDDGGEPVIGLEITSWLRGPRVVQRPFAVKTSAGTLPVRGAHLVAAIPAATTQLRTGESIVVLGPGEDVQIAGHGDAGGDPFRTSAVPVADAMYVAPASFASDGFASAALVMWRPCVAYLLIVSAIAVPALAALTAS
jgi:hypothetical protein